MGPNQPKKNPTQPRPGAPSGQGACDKGQYHQMAELAEDVKELKETVRECLAKLDKEGEI